MSFPDHRKRRLRVSEPMRRLVRETHLEPSQFVLPLFVCPGEGVRKAHQLHAGQLPAVGR